MVTFAQAAVVHGPSYLEHTWLPGYAWAMAHCARCGVFAGWHFKASSSSVQAAVHEEEEHHRKGGLSHRAEVHDDPASRYRYSREAQGGMGQERRLESVVAILVDLLQCETPSLLMSPKY